MFLRFNYTRRISKLTVYKDHVEVGSEDGSAALRVLANDVYKFDESLFRRIRNAQSEGDESLIQELWSKATHLKECVS